MSKETLYWLGGLPPFSILTENKYGTLNTYNFEYEQRQKSDSYYILPSEYKGVYEIGDHIQVVMYDDKRVDYKKYGIVLGWDANRISKHLLSKWNADKEIAIQKITNKLYAEKSKISEKAIKEMMQSSWCFSEENIEKFKRTQEEKINSLEKQLKECKKTKKPSLAKAKKIIENYKVKPCMSKTTKQQIADLISDNQSQSYLSKRQEEIDEAVKIKLSREQLKTLLMIFASTVIITIVAMHLVITQILNIQ